VRRRRVVVTGLGAVTPVGNDVAATWRALLDGRSGGAPITKFDAEKFAVRFACEVKDFDAGLYMDRKEAKRADLYAQYAMAASVQAMQDAGFADGTGPAAGFDPLEFGVVIGSGIGGLRTMEEQHGTYLAQGPRRISPFFVPMFISDIAAGIVSMRFGLKGPNFATVSACSTSAHAMGVAARAIEHGEADLMLAAAARRRSRRWPSAGSRAWARSPRATTAPPPRRARSTRRATASCSGRARASWCSSCSSTRWRAARGSTPNSPGTRPPATRTTSPAARRARGLQRAMRRALKDAGVAPEEVDYVNAHGTSTPLNDPNEAKAIRAVFGDHADRLAVSSTKSATGHMLGAAGVVEAIACAKAIQEGCIPPTINHATPDPEITLDVTPNTPRERPCAWR
jgi:3-oxoacyl-[acyl-carrier-protein] synthase II